MGKVDHAIATKDAVYAFGVRGDSPAAYALSSSGERGWVFDSRADIHRAYWPTLAAGMVVVNDDGLYLIDAATGRSGTHGIDQWGPSLEAGGQLYLTNALQVDGPGFFVAAYTTGGKVGWKGDVQPLGRQAFVDNQGGICEDGGILVHAANYKHPNLSRISAFDMRTGERRWSERTKPLGPPAAMDGMVFTVEARGKDQEVLVARALEDGRVLWTHDAPGARGASPVLAGTRLIFHGELGVVALDRETGAAAWTAGIPRAPSKIAAATSLAAASGSGTLVVTQEDTVRVLSLVDGTEMWRGVPRAGAREVHSPIVVGETVYVVADGALLELVR